MKAGLKEVLTKAHEASIAVLRINNFPRTLEIRLVLKWWWIQDVTGK